jgi:hypothetical protein
MSRYIRQQRRNRATGTVVTVYDTAHPDAYLDPDGGRWVTLCEDHGNLVNHDTLALARSHAVWPDWCGDCQATLYGPVP